MGKKIVCFCMDVTEKEIIQAIELGYTDIESIKRYTGMGTGPCQGKICLINTIKILANKTGRKVEDVGKITIRKPLFPVYIGTLAEGEKK